MRTFGGGSGGGRVEILRRFLGRNLTRGRVLVVGFGTI